MKKIILPLILVVSGIAILSSCSNLYGSAVRNDPSYKNTQSIVYFNPEIHPDIDDIKFNTYQAVYDGVTNKIGKLDNVKLVHIETPLSYDDVNVEMIKEICKNNDSDYAIIPKIKYFKVGIGKYVFSNQVVISMKLYDSNGNFITECTHDTYKKNKRLLGTTTNSIKIGTNGALSGIIKTLRTIPKTKKSDTSS